MATALALCALQGHCTEPSSIDKMMKLFGIAPNSITCFLALALGSRKLKHAHRAAVCAWHGGHFRAHRQPLLSSGSRSGWLVVFSACGGKQCTREEGLVSWRAGLSH